MKKPLSFGFVFLGAAVVAFAQDASWEYAVDLAWEHGLEAGLEDTGSEAQRTAYSAALSAAYIPQRGKSYKLTVGAGTTEYDWSEPVALPGLGEDLIAVPFEEASQTGIGFEASRMMSREWGLFLRGGYQWRVGEAAWSAMDADRSDGGSGQAIVGATWFFGPDVILSGGFAFFERLEEDELLIPLIFLRWRINDYWTLTTGREITFHYDLNADGQHRFFAGVSYQTESFAITQMAGEGTAGSPVIGSTEGARLKVGYEWKAFDDVTFKPYLSFDFGEELEFRAFGRSIESFDFDSRVSFGLRVSGRF